MKLVLQLFRVASRYFYGAFKALGNLGLLVEFYGGQPRGCLLSGHELQYQRCKQILRL